MPPAQNSGTGSQPLSATSSTISNGAPSSLAWAESCSLAQRAEMLDAADDSPQVANRLDDVACPGFALGADHRRTLPDPPQRFAEVGGATDERNLERVLVDVVRLVGGSQHLGLVDVVHLQRLEHLGLREVADARLGHHRDRHRVLDLLDHPGAGHPRDAAGGADVGRDALQCHHRNRARLLGDPSLLGGGHVHDHPALEHLGEAALDPECGPFGHAPNIRGARGAAIGGRSGLATKSRWLRVGLPGQVRALARRKRRPKAEASGGVIWIRAQCAAVVTST